MDPAVQQRLFDHPADLVALLDKHVACCQGDRGITAPSFYHYTSYPFIHGAHSAGTYEQIDSILEWTRWAQTFTDKYHDFASLFVDPEGVMKQVPIGTGWQDDRALLEVAGQWMYADAIEKECAAYLNYVDMLADFDKKREQELALLMQQTSSELIPMGWSGLGHTLRMAERLRESFRIHILTPSASIHLDKKRSSHPVNSPESPLMNVGLFRALLHWSRNVPPLKK
jgi:hypothetical protein